MSLVDSALKSAQKLTDSMGNGGVAAVHASNKLFGDGFELTCLGWAIRGVDPVNLCSWEEVNHVGDNKPNELGFVQDFSYKYKINAVHYYGYPSKLQETQFFVDDLGPLKSKLREYKKEVMKEKMTVSEAMEILKESGKKAINESYLEQVNVEELYSLALESLFFADQVHLWHWTCKSGFHHTHLQEVYESLRDFADELVEICLASGKKFAVKANTRELGGDGDFDVQDAIDELEEFIDQIQATGKGFKEESEITTLIDDEAKALTKELGLLKSFS
jgi:DNA-binding ferritin-like protein